MIEKLGESSGNVIGFKPIGDITKADYDVLVPEVESLVQQEGDIRVLMDMTGFKWEKVEAWGADWKLGRDFHQKISKMAIVGDKTWEKWLAKVAAPFYAVEAKFFHPEETDKAWAWLREDH